MKNFLLAVVISFSAVGCATVDTSYEANNLPAGGTLTGEQFMAFLFAHANHPLKGEPNCTLDDVGTPRAQTIGDFIAKMVGDDAMWLSENNGNNPDNRKLSVYTDCGGLYDIAEVNGKVVQGWDCGINFVNTMDGNDFVSNAAVRIGISPDMKTIVKGTIRCF